ncbi:MAG: response regulator transcription factor [Solirubrobacterales bacterium]
MARTVLVVDDHPGFRARACRMLQEGGFEVVGVAADGGEAIESAARLEPDLVLLDVKLPDSDGFAVASELSRAKARPAVILTSSHSRADLGGSVEGSGAVGFIPKVELTSEAVGGLLE